MHTTREKQIGFGRCFRLCRSLLSVLSIWRPIALLERREGHLVPNEALNLTLAIFLGIWGTVST